MGSRIVKYVRPDQGGAGIQAAITAIMAGDNDGGVIQLTKGTYVITTSISTTGGREPKNVTIQGAGNDTVLSVQLPSPGMAFHILGTWYRNQNAAAFSVGATSLTMSPVGAAANIKANHVLFIKGYDASGAWDMEIAVAAADGDGGTGVVTLKSPLVKALSTSVKVTNMYGNNVTLRNFRMVKANSVYSDALYFDGVEHGLIENVVFEDFLASSGGSDSSLYMRECTDVEVRGCKIHDTRYWGIRLEDCYNVRLIGNTLDKCYVFGDEGALNLVTSADILIKGNEIINGAGYGISGRYGTIRRIIVQDNILRYTTGNSIQLTDPNECIVSGNIIDGSQAGAINLLGTASAASVLNNIIQACAGTSIQLANTITDSIVIGNSCVGGTIVLGSGAGNISGLNRE